MSDDKPMTTDRIAPLLAEGDTVGYKELIEKLEDLFNKNTHKMYDTFHVSMVKDQKLGIALVFEGKREETKEETYRRETNEFATKKRIEDAELKEYLRLHKKYGKKTKKKK